MDRDRMQEAVRVLRVELIGLDRERQDWERAKRNGKAAVQAAGRNIEDLRVRATRVRGRIEDVERELGEEVGGDCGGGMGKARVRAAPGGTVLGGGKDRGAARVDSEKSA